MKKILTLALALALTLTMVACGEKPAPAPAASTPAASSKPAAPAASSKPDLANPEYTPEQLAVAEKFAAMSDSFNALVDKINADEALLEVTELVDTMNTLADAINEDDAMFADPKNLTPDVLKNLEEGIVVGNDFVKKIEAMVKNYQGKKTITAKIEIVNETGVEIHDLAMSPANSTEWGGNMLDSPLLAGESGITEMTFTEDTLVWDLLAGDSTGQTLEFMGIDFAEAPMEGAKLVLSATEGGAYMAAFAS